MVDSTEWSNYQLLIRVQELINAGKIIRSDLFNLPRLCWNLEITRTYSDIECSEYFLNVTGGFYIGTMKMPIETNNSDVETYRNKLGNGILLP